MTKEVQVTIEGKQLGNDEEPIIVTVPGTYHYTNGKHYVQYQEKLTDGETYSKNIIKISASNVLLSKKSAGVSQMEFDLKEVTQTVYQTAYGNLHFDVRTNSIVLLEEDDRIRVRMNYSLSTGDSLVSDNSILITILSVR